MLVATGPPPVEIMNGPLPFKILPIPSHELPLNTITIRLLYKRFARSKNAPHNHVNGMYTPETNDLKCIIQNARYNMRDPRARSEIREAKSEGEIRNCCFLVNFLSAHFFILFGVLGNPFNLLFINIRCFSGFNPNVINK